VVIVPATATATATATGDSDSDPTVMVDANFGKRHGQGICSTVLVLSAWGHDAPASAQIRTWQSHKTFA
jgi:hypothetical protein